MFVGRMVNDDTVIYAKGNVENEGGEEEDERAKSEAYWTLCVYID